MKHIFKSRTKRLLADACTPVQLYLHVRDHFPEVVLLETAAGTDGPARSYICFDTLAAICLHQGNVTITAPGSTGVTETVAVQNALAPMLSAFMQTISVADGDVDGISGLHGYISYDAVRYTADAPADFNATSAIPEVYFGFYRFVLTFDHRKHELYITERYPSTEQPHGTTVIESFIRKPLLHAPFSLSSAEQADCDDDDFLQMAAKAKAHCYIGDVFQVVLSRLFSVAYRGDDFNVYRQLRSINPSPYMFCCDYGNFRLMGASPEAQLIVKNGTAVLHPIAGTFRSTGNIADDGQLAQALLEDPKENAEHVMLVDLARNDLSRSYGSVAVTRFKEVKQYSHLMHIVSEVTGTTPVDGRNSIDALCDSFPAGTLSGAPKHRAMQLISQYEHSQRAYYGGCIGYLGFDGEVNMAIMIRSLLSKDRTLYYRAGAGIVAASDEQKELEEINNKLRAVRTAIARANEQP